MQSISKNTADATITGGIAQATPSGPLRADGRRPPELRPLTFQHGVAPHATGSTLVSFGHTKVICAVTIEEGVPRWMKEQGVVGGWITAEYSMLPYSTHQRKARDITKGKIDGRSQEIQRLVGRALRAAVDLEGLGSRTVWIDCDVLQADGGTRTAAITGACVALALAIQRLLAAGTLTKNPLLGRVAAVSVGLVDGQALLDLNYGEDSTAAVDFNVVMNDRGEYIELQGTGEKTTFSGRELEELLALARAGITELIQAQSKAIQTGVA